MNIFARKPYLLALLFTATLAIWLLSGGSHADKTPIITPSSAITPAIMKVRVQTLVAQPLLREIVVTGRTAPYRMVTLRAEIDGRIVETPAERGARVKKNQSVVRLATEDRETRLKEAQALLLQREADYKAKRDLAKKGFQPETQIAEAFSLVESAKNLVMQAQLAVDNLLIRIPFDGILTQRTVEMGDYVRAGDAVAEVLDESKFLVIGDLNELDRAAVHVGNPVKIHLITGAEVDGKVSLLAARAEAATRTFSIEIEIPNDHKTLSAGLSSEIRIPVETIAAHHISAALLALNDAGVVGVKAVNAKNVVEFYPAELVRAEGSGVWLQHLPAKLQLITVGQGFVRPGDIVQPIVQDAKK
jgi:multidrug efflux system membrane fusion protein